MAKVKTQTQKALERAAGPLAFGTNVTMALEDELKTLVIRVNLKERHGSSASGRSEIIATTHGFARFQGVGISLNVTVPKNGA